MIRFPRMTPFYIAAIVVLSALASNWASSANRAPRRSTRWQAMPRKSERIRSG